METENLTISKERVLAAAEKRPKHKAFLKEMFPEAFEDKKYFDLSKETSNPLCNYSGNELNFCLFVGKGIAPDELANKCFVLVNYGDASWEFKKDGNYYYLIPTRKDNQ